MMSDDNMFNNRINSARNTEFRQLFICVAVEFFKEIICTCRNVIEENIGRFNQFYKYNLNYAIDASNCLKIYLYNWSLNRTYFELVQNEPLFLIKNMH